MKSTLPILTLAIAAGFTSCNPKSGEAENAAASKAEAGATASAAGNADATAADAGQPDKSGPRDESAGAETKTTASGLKYTVLKKGTGTVNPKEIDTVTVHYHGTLQNGTVFDSSVDRGEPTSFPLNRVIAGWTEGVQLMVVGDKFKFEIPANLAYGENSPSPAIPPNSTLVFEVELLGIQ